MSLSRDLKRLAVWFGEVQDGGAEFTAEGARAFRSELDRCAWNAQAIEEAAGAGEPDLIDPALANVVAFRPRRVSRVIPINGGDAA